LVQSLAKEGGLQSTLWAGPEKFSAAELEGKAIPQGKVRKNPVALKLGFTSDDFSYTIDLGLPPPSSRTAFGLDPIIKRECFWRGHDRSQRMMCVDRRGNHVCVRPERSWQEIDILLGHYVSVLTEYSNPVLAPELLLMREMIRDWRFYDQFRTDGDAPSRRVEIGTFTPVLSNNGADLAAALQTIRESGDGEALDRAIDDAFPGSRVHVESSVGRFELMLEQSGMLRKLRSAELSDGTLRYLLLCAALLSPDPPQLMVLNEPEMSLHPDLLPAVGRLIEAFATRSQTIVVTHSQELIRQLSAVDQCVHFELQKHLGMTVLADVNPLEIPAWDWPPR
jgi:predicted ATPase